MRTRQPVRRKVRRSQVAQPYSVPAPVYGWNARDSMAAMKKGDAISLENWFPTQAGVDLRSGSDEHVTGITGQGETLGSYRPPTGSHKLFAFAGTAAYDVSSAGAVGAAVLSSLSNARWQTTLFTTSGGNFLLAVNGADSMRSYDGTTWTTITGVSTPAITGVTTSTLVHVNVFKERVWYVQANTMDVWYSAAGAFAGALTKFALGSIFKRGGYLVAMGTWSVDGGTGPEDLAVFITSEGEVAVYQGSNPASASTWGLVGIYNVGAPIGRRCFLKYGGDLLILTVDGIVAASKSLTDRRTSGNKDLTDKISGAMSSATTLYGTNFGWEMTQFSEGGALILNVPTISGAQQQYVMNTTTSAWTKFTGWPANCFEVHNKQLYFGMSGEVRHAWTGTSDNGANIVADMVGAFDYFGSRIGNKIMKMMRPVIAWDANPAEIFMNTDVDFKIVTPTSAIALPSSAGSGVWDVGEWDEALWAGDLEMNKAWYGANGVGYAIAPHLKVSSASSRIQLVAFDYLYERGSPF
jgi:hypothetical protein